ncbi:MAG: sugar phosphate isomerase/epimerase [Armatimonadetes bacterium]|nr:sugar phosphate isomerase/epimerase [Armatimonadota bacterium]
MTKCISYWSVEGGGAGACPVADAMDQAKAAGFDGIELAVAQSGVLTPETDEATCRAYAQMAVNRGLLLESVASGMSWAVCPTHPDPAVRRRSIDLHAAALQRAAWVGAQAMLFVPGAVVIPWDPSYPPVRYDHALTWAREAVAELGDVAAAVGVDLAVENVWNGLFYSPVEFVEFLDGIGNPRVGAYFDVGNVLNHQQWPPHWIELLGPRLRRVHVKDFQLAVGNLGGFCDLLAGDVPFAATMAALRSIGYEGTLVAEMGPPDATLLERTSRAMDTILAM